MEFETQRPDPARSVDFTTGNHDASTRDGIESGDHGQDGRLTATGMTDDGNHFALRHDQVEFRDDRNVFAIRIGIGFTEPIKLTNLRSPGSILSFILSMVRGRDNRTRSYAPIAIGCRSGNGTTLAVRACRDSSLYCIHMPRHLIRRSLNRGFEFKVVPIAVGVGNVTMNSSPNVARGPGVSAMIDPP